MATPAPAPRVRVRVLFADEVGRHVQRRLGFSGCWFLVPSGARLVGDLAFALVQEFGLAARCPAGVDLAVDGLHVPASQDICVVRDGDAVTVQCAQAPRPLSKRRRRLLEAEDDAESLAVSPLLSSADGDDGDEREEGSLRTVVRRLRDQRLALRHKGKALKKASKRLEIKPAPATKPGKEKTKRKAKLAMLKSSDSSSESSSSDSDSSSSSSSSSSSGSSSDKDTTSTNGGGGKKTAAAKSTPISQSDKEAQPERPATARDGAKAGKTTSAGNEGEEKPRRQRRRQRRRRRDRNGNASVVQEGASGGKEVATSVSEAGGTAAELPNVATAGPRREVRTRFPQSKAHFRFDGANGEVTAVVHPSGSPSTYREAPAGLEKYGPSPHEGSSSGGAADGRSRPDSESNTGERRRRQQGDAGNAPESASGFGPQRKKAKIHGDEMWKRPYEVLASVLDKPQDGADASKADLTALLAGFPSPSAGDLSASSFQLDDVVAFKTLRLCMETWQPIVSDWQCGRVLAVTTEAGVTLEMRELSDGDDTSEPSVRFDTLLDGEDAAKEVPVGEFSELRYVGGPTLEALRRSGE